MTKQKKSKLTSKPPSWVRISGGTNKAPKIKVPKGQKIIDVWSGNTVITVEFRKVDIEKHTLAYIQKAIGEIESLLLDGKEILAYRNINKLSKVITSKEKIIDVTRRYNLNNKNKITKIASTNYWVKLKKENRNNDE